MTFSSNRLEVLIPGIDIETAAFYDDKKAFAVDSLTIDWGRSDYFSAPRKRQCRIKLVINHSGTFEKAMKTLLRSILIVSIKPENWLLFAGQIVAFDVTYSDSNPSSRWSIDVQAVEQEPKFVDSFEKEAWTIKANELFKGTRPDDDRQFYVNSGEFMQWLLNTGSTPPLKYDKPGFMMTHDLGTGYKHFTHFNQVQLNAYVTNKQHLEDLANPAPGVYQQWTPGGMDWRATHTNFGALRDKTNAVHFYSKNELVSQKKLTSSIQNLPLGLWWEMNSKGEGWKWDAAFQYLVGTQIVPRADKYRRFNLKIIPTEASVQKWGRFLMGCIESMPYDMPDVTVSSELSPQMFKADVNRGNAYAHQPNATCPIGFRTWETEQKLAYGYGVYGAFIGQEMVMLPIGGSLKIKGAYRGFTVEHKIHTFQWV